VASVNGHEDRLVLDRGMVLCPAGDFDRRGELELANFFALADRLGQELVGSLVAYDLSGDGRINLADAQLLLQWLGLAGKGVAGFHRVGWDGRTDEGRALTSGLYPAALDWSDGFSVRRLTFLH